MRPGRAPLMLIAVVLAGCATGGPGIRPAEVTLSAVEVKHVDLGKQSLRLDFGVVNPNPFPLPVRAIRYELRLGDRKAARGETVEPFVVAARGDGAFSIDIELDVVDSLSQLGFQVFREQIEYELYGSLTVDLPFAQPMAFTHSGQVDLHSGSGLP